MSYHLYLSFILTSIAFALACCVGRWRELDAAAKIMGVAVFVGFLNEVVAFFFATNYGTNFPVYNVYGIFELILFAFYFNKSVQTLVKSKIGFIVSILGIAMWLINYRFFQPIEVFNSYFILFEGFCVIALALFALSQLLLNDDNLRLTKYPHFWFTIVILFFWCINYLNWGMYSILRNLLKENIDVIHIGMLIVTVSLYWCLGLIFLFYKKMQLVRE